MNGKSLASLILALICVFSVFSSFSRVRSQPYYDAWFAHVYVTHGNGEIDLINGGNAKVNVGTVAFQKLVYYNEGIGDYGARLYTKIYRDNLLVGTSTTDVDAYLRCNSSRTDEYSSLFISNDGGRTYSYKVELWWRKMGDLWSGEEHRLVDVKEFELKVVKLSISYWDPSYVSVDRGFGTGTLNVAFTNGGNDNMNEVKVTVVNSAGLTVTPQTQNLSVINEGERKFANFSIQASQGIPLGNYTLTFEIAYNDFIGATHRETFTANATVTSNFIIDNLYLIITVSAITAICLVALAYFTKSRRSETKTPPPP